MIYLRKQTTRDGRPVFLPASCHAEEKAREIKDGKVIKATETEDRNWRLHDKYFAVLHTVFENQEQFKSSEQLREATLIEIGYTELREKFNGERYLVAASMATGKILPCWTIEKIYEASIDAWCRHFGFDRALLEGEIAA